MDDIRALEFRAGVLRLLDQRRLPHEIVWIECGDSATVAEAIRTLSVRGAPAIGLAAAYGVVLAAANAGTSSVTWRAEVEHALHTLAGTRPTAVNLFWALGRMRAVIEDHPIESREELTRLLKAEADSMMAEDEAANRAMTGFAASLIPDGARVLTHCNTGALVSSVLGTALGAIRVAHEQGKSVHVWVDETRPLLQGARLTTWELQQLGIPFTLITDNMAAHFMARRQIDLAMVGADRIAANGDTANKIGTYGVAVLAQAHGLPFYVVAPTSTVDLGIPSGEAIRIEERRPEEVTSFGGVQVCLPNVHVANPAFDVTPAGLIAAVVTEGGIARRPYEPQLAHHVQAARAHGSTALIGP